MNKPDLAGNGCPVTGLGAEFNPFEDPYLTDPYPFLARARTDEPVFYSPELDYWVLTRHDDITAVFRDLDSYSADIAQSPVKPLYPSVVKAIKDGGFTPTPIMSNCDQPKHTRIRRHTARAFTSRRIAVLEPYIRDLADKYIDAFEGRGHAELVGEMVYELPALVILKMLGIPDEDVAAIKSWSSNRLMLTWGRLSETEQLDQVQGLIEYWHYCVRHIDRKLENPGDDFPSDLIAVRDGNDEILTIEEIVNVVYGLLIAGHETTTSSSANAVRSLLEDGAAWTELCENPELIVNAVEEVLRVNTSVIAWRRRTRVPVTIRGVDIPKDAKLLLMLASANHDPEVFPEPDKVDLHRTNSKDHISFGLGIHFCFGAPLARLELRIILEQLTRRLPHMKLVDGQSFRFHPNTSFRGPIALQVEWPKP